MSRGLRVGVYVHSCLPFMRAGSEVMLHTMLKALQSQGHQVRVAATADRKAPEIWEHDGIHGWGWPVRKGGRTAAECLRRWKPDVVITHHGESRAAAALAKRCGAKLVFLVHNDHHFTKAFVHGMKPDLTVFNTRWIHGRFRAALRSAGAGLPAVVVHPPVDPELHRTTPGHMVTLINLHPKKGSHTFYSLADRLPDLQFLGVKGGYWADQDIRVRPNVEIIANTTNMRDDVWARTGVLLVPSVYESYGLVAVEAAASGIPVIAAITPGLKESMTGIGPDGDWDAAIFRRWNDVKGYAEALESLTDGATWTAWSQRSFNRSVQIAADNDMERFLDAFEWAIVRNQDR